MLWKENIDLKLLTLITFEETDSIKGIIDINKNFISYYVRGILTTFKRLSLN